MIYDIAVIGLGGMGSATAAHAAARGRSVAGLEQFTPAHALGASHGRTRLIRMAYFEGPQYVPLLRRAYELWDELEKETGRTLRSRTGGVFVGTPDSNLIAGTLASAAAYNLQVQSLNRAELEKRYPQLRPIEGEVGVFEPAAGAVFPEETVRAQLEVARAHGADLHFETRVLGWEEREGAFCVSIEGGGAIRARKLAVCAGPWFSEVLRGLRIPVKAERNVQTWFAPRAHGEFTPERFYAFALERDGKFFYGFPDYGDGVKCAFHHTGISTTPATLVREIAPTEIAANRAALADFVPGAAGTFKDASACMYALTPDEHFVIGEHPLLPNVFIAGGFSGHGFKFCPVIGEIMSNLLVDGESKHEIGMFSPDRFLKTS